MAAPTTGSRRGIVVALILVTWLSGCDLGANRPTIRAADVARELESATGITLRAVRPPFELPGLPELATTLSGGTTYESLTVVVFFEPEGAKRLLGSGRRPSGTTVLTRLNVVVLYRSSPRAADRSRQVRRALEAVIVGA